MTDKKSAPKKKPAAKKGKASPAKKKAAANPNKTPNSEPKHAHAADCHHEHEAAHTAQAAHISSVWQAPQKKKKNLWEKIFRFKI